MRLPFDKISNLFSSAATAAATNSCQFQWVVETRKQIRLFVVCSLYPFTGPDPNPMEGNRLLDPFGTYFGSMQSWAR